MTELILGNPQCYPREFHIQYNIIKISMIFFTKRLKITFRIVKSVLYRKNSAVNIKVSDIKLYYRAIITKQCDNGTKQTSRSNNRQELSERDSESMRHVPRIDKWYRKIKTLLTTKKQSLQ